MLFDHEFDEGGGAAPSSPGAATDVEGWLLPGATGIEGIGCLSDAIGPGEPPRHPISTHPISTT